MDTGEVAMPWGTPEEKYRWACLRLLAWRYAYYVLAQPLVSDAEYDAFEDKVRQIESVMPQLKHPKSPTQVPGSDNAEDYPPSVRRWAEQEVLTATRKSL
jgi:DNA ligase (NAD+)